MYRCACIYTPMLLIILFAYVHVTTELGLTGIPVFNTNNNCSSASSALMLARALVLSGYDCTIAIGKFCMLINYNKSHL